MKIGVLGLGRMGGNIACRLMDSGHECVVYDTSAEAVRRITEAGGQGADSLAAMVEALPKPRTLWLMLPAGEVTENAIAELAPMLDAGDTLIDGGNANFKDDVRRARTLAERDIRYMDVGVSGGVWGRERGFCLMIGGEQDNAERLDPIFATLAPGTGDIESTPGRSETLDPRAEQGYLYCGPAGSGHFVKMVHNGIEYGMMAAYAEGFDILKNRTADFLPEDERFDLNLADIAEVWRRGSVISSWLLDLTSIALAEDQSLDEFTGEVSDSGEGRWTVNAAVEQAVPANVLSAALFARFRSRHTPSFGDKLQSAMRNQFGGHVETHND
ncbi:phosphogluconate dehydrogenase (NAD(+)-dependent, decarboxylating) [Salinisphaera hydrothermalis]|uniref:phosphogluconate dehydrogenase (NAD(+)-dependent, decarboxylating) n=1 Tax=Salinisphaera hydrothermalis TaxID=563188 RepID=UPI003340FA8B